MLSKFRKPFRSYPVWARMLALLVVIGVISMMRTSPPVENAVNPRKPLQLDTSLTDWTSEELKRNPNIIIVLSESFWDPTLMKDLTFSRDPIPTFHELSKKYTSGWMLSPQFGGGTANVELEVLTGNSMRFLPENTIAYEEFVKRDIESLASILSSRNYTPTAITPFYDWYFDSRNVYRHFGFSRYISYEFFNPDEFVGPYIGDHAVAKRIIEESARTEGADFIFANTMENHYHYYANKFERNTIRIKDKKDTMAGAAIDILETYAQGANGADAMLQELVEHYSKVKEPTIVVFFGDHLPFFEEDYYVYREGHYLQGEEDPDFLQKTHKVPLLIWNNYLQEGREDLYFNPSFLGPYVLNLAKIKGSDYTDFLSQLSKKIPIIPPKSYYEAMNINEADLTEYQSRQQVMMFGGDRNTPESMDDPPIQPTLIMGYGDPVITSVTPDSLSTGDGASLTDTKKMIQITLTGGRYGIGSVVYVNGKPMQTKWESEQELTADLPKSLLAKPGNLELQVKVVDEKENILAQSKPYFLPVLVRKTSIDGTRR
ncbi:LTA synthase family protein [Paenibacillus sp. NPDC056579]|uniref:LTA synthase family protein n=1 Tax=Paenibacillus sp. NPDC056579 TaxID=3345871 RepID=UPI003674727D